MPATLLSEEPLTLTNAPRLSDIATMSALLRSFGAEVSSMNEGLVVALSSHNIGNLTADYDLVRKMRASNLVLGPLLARFGQAVVSLPGGCAVGATENFIMAASLGQGVSVFENAAREPEIVDLIDCLGKMGAQIDGGGSETITIQGVERLHGATHPVVTDRIELGTYMLAPVIAGGQVELLGGRINLLSAFCEKLDAIGVDVVETAGGLQVSRRSDVLKSVNVKTEVFPGFPTDLQAQMMALLCTAKGTSVLEETIFENRFMHAPELMRMGAQIDVQGGVAKVSGVDHLKGAPVMATDLRASVSLILAGLAAEGETVVSRVYHLDRGYEKLEAKLQAVGAKVERISS